MLDKIIQNACHCKNCDSYVISLSSHDYRRCECGEIAVDGGLDYLKRSYSNADLIEEYSLTDKSDWNEICKKLMWGTRGKDGNSDVKFLPICLLETDHLLALKTYQPMNNLHKRVVIRELRKRKIKIIEENG